MIFENSKFLIVNISISISIFLMTEKCIHKHQRKQQKKTVTGLLFHLYISVYIFFINKFKHTHTRDNA